MSLIYIYKGVKQKYRQHDSSLYDMFLIQGDCNPRIFLNRSYLPRSQNALCAKDNLYTSTLYIWQITWRQSIETFIQ